MACIEREWPPFMQWHRFWLSPSYIEKIALMTAVPFNTGNPSGASRSRQLKAALQVFPHCKVQLTFRYSWKRLRKRCSKSLIKFSQVYIAFVLQCVHCFEKKNIYWLNESWKTRLPKRLKCTIIFLRYVHRARGDLRGANFTLSVYLEGHRSPFWRSCYLVLIIPIKLNI